MRSQSFKDKSDEFSDLCIILSPSLRFDIAHVVASGSNFNVRAMNLGEAVLKVSLHLTRNVSMHRLSSEARHLIRQKSL